jgi:peptidoglycan/LPS O-acetylase OafA/YrhL
VVAIRQAIVGPAAAVPGFGADGIATLFYFANWHQIASGSGYFAQTALVSPLQHTWSLAIEEQFYLVWPLLLLGVAALALRLRRNVLRCLLVVAVVGSLASAVEMAVLFHAGSDLDRVYYGTDTRAQGLLAGAALAIVLAIMRERAEGAGRTRPSRPFTIALQVSGGVAVAVLAVAVVRSSGASSWIYRGGFLVTDVATVAVIASATTQRAMFSLTRVVLEWAPLRWIGVVSYGLYLWHFPLFLWLDSASTGLDGAGLLGLRLAVTLAVATVSFVLIEQPIRERRLHAGLVRVLGATGLSGAVVAVLVASNVASAAPLSIPVPVTTSAPAAPAPAAGTPAPKSASQSSAQSSAVQRLSWVGTSPSCRVRLPVPAPYRAFQTFHTCPPERVMFVGDSVSLTLDLQMGYLEPNYGVLLEDAAELGCGFVTRGLINADGSFGPTYSPCDDAFTTWQRDADQFHPQVVVVEMGWWDSMDRLWNGHVVHLGQPAYDNYLLSRMITLGKDLTPPGTHVVFLTVPWMDPPPFPDGSAPPAASAARHDEINRLLAEAVSRLGPGARLFDIGPYVTPSGHFQFDVGGSVCRTSDGIHFYYGTNGEKVVPTRCGLNLQAALLPFLRRVAGPVRYSPVRARSSASP